MIDFYAKPLKQGDCWVIRCPKCNARIASCREDMPKMKDWLEKQLWGCDCNT